MLQYVMLHPTNSNSSTELLSCRDEYQSRLTVGHHVRPSPLQPHGKWSSADVCNLQL